MSSVTSLEDMKKQKTDLPVTEAAERAKIMKLWEEEDAKCVTEKNRRALIIKLWKRVDAIRELEDKAVRYF